METITVTQAFKANLNNVKDYNKSQKTPYNVSPEVSVGKYTKEEFEKIAGKDFINSPKYSEYLEIGWIKVTKEQDVSQQFLKKIKKS